ncbi:MAG: acetyl-CoA carboxylase carboxyltransferase subunit beta [Alphaproteobacteria bacterium]|nr:acetyl-CoA carboxylase carboxyltransferase subunit beta [Alphaproteobacteria bacterium]
MNWLENFVRPKLQALVSRDHSDSAENKWRSCPNCAQMLFLNDLPKNLYLCQQCGHHLRMPAPARLESIFDSGFTNLPEVAVVEDPLKFRDKKRYLDRLKDSRAKMKCQDAVQSAFGTIAGEKAVAAVFDFRFMGGSMGSAAGSALVQAANKALSEQCGLIVFTSSGGARMQEGIISLMQLPRSIIATEMLQQAGLPYIVVLCDPTTGGVSASFAMLGDIHIAEPGATIGFAGRRVIEQTVRETLPEGFQQAEDLIDKGVIDMIVPREDIAARLGLLLHLMGGKARLLTENDDSSDHDDAAHNHSEDDGSGVEKSAPVVS